MVKAHFETIRMFSKLFLVGRLVGWSVGRYRASA